MWWRPSSFKSAFFSPYSLTVSPKPVLLVDARNVLRSLWPNMPEDELVERARARAAAEGAALVLVFDGCAPGEIVGEEHLGGDVVLVGTGAESADAWIARAAAGLRNRGDPFWLVTSDRTLRAEAGAGAERTIGGGSFARALRR